ncbi:adenylate/guanylate cyclase domain-containing protein [Aureimonas sp. SA4125]|uniref:adenylate/guanylate cyclase domain-containing protein n=1 Tax=Aureimonas sp. SA4125 TaxID=2826993 RepID=UPI001CC5C9AD|nr:adenylate/guanylate cyclase domain-containing protein [Aureimonas sp. SA4125]
MAQAVNWRDGIDVLLARLGQAAEVSRVYLFEIGRTETGHLTQGCFHDWAAPGLERLAGHARYAREIVEQFGPTFDCWIERRRRGELIKGHTRELSGPLREDFDYQKIQSFMSVPIHVEGEWWGHLGFDDCINEREWSRDEEHLLKTTAALIGASVAREGVSRRLRDNEKMRAAMLDVALDGIILVDDEGVAFECNPAAQTMFGRSREELIGERIADHLVPERLRASHMQRFREAVRERKRGVPAQRREMIAMQRDGTEFLAEASFVQIARGEEFIYALFIRDLTERQAAEEGMRRAERDRANLARFFSPQLVEHMISIEKPLSVDHYQPATVLFADMIGFTSFCADNYPRTVIDMLRELLALLSEQVFAHDGTIDKFMGDGMMAVFGSPKPGRRDATNAICCARAMQAAVDDWNVGKGRRGEDAIRVAIGIHTGHVILGDIGSAKRLEFAVLGDVVNIASRVEGKNRSLDTNILLTAEVMQALEREDGLDVAIDAEDFGLQPLRGRTTGVHLYGWRRS